MRNVALKMIKKIPRDWLRKVSKDDIESTFGKYPTPEEYRLDDSYSRVRMLLDFTELIETNLEKLKNPLAKACIEKNVMPSAILIDYIILEISSYYTNAHNMKRGGLDLPEIPSYWKDLKAFRNLGPGHRDKDYKLKSLGDYILEAKKLDSLNVVKVVEDFIDYAREVKIKQMSKQKDFTSDTTTTSKDT